MSTLPDHFQELLTAIEPNEKRRTLAQDITLNLRNFLKEGDKIHTIAPHSRLAGSFARDTATNDIKDVDIILRIDEAYRQEAVESALDAVFSALYGFPKYLDDEGEVTVRRRQRRSVNVELTKANFNLDIVPAIALEGMDKPLQIPDREWSKWVATHPLGYGDKLSEINGQHGDKIVPLIKLFKYWRDVQMTYRRPKSYWLECLVFGHITSKRLVTNGKSYAELFRDLLLVVKEEFDPWVDNDEVPEIADPMLGHNVAHNWEPEQFGSFIRRINESLNWATRALNAGEEKDAVSLWQNIFGTEKFPKSIAEIKGRQLNRALLAGNVFVTQQNRRVVINTPQQPATQVKPQRFYGDDNA